MMPNQVLVNSIVQKGLIALSGLFLVGFLLFHLWGNVLLLDTPGTYNHLAQTLENLGWGLRGLEIILLLALVIHVWLTIMIRRQQKKFAPKHIHLRQKRVWAGNWTVNLTSRLMGFTGSLILVFLILHLRHFRFYTGEKDLEQIVHQLFQSPSWVMVYELALFPLGCHLAHGLGSGLQSLGLGYPKITPFLPSLSQTLSGVIMLGYAIIPLIIYRQSP